MVGLGLWFSLKSAKIKVSMTISPGWSTCTKNPFEEAAPIDLNVFISTIKGLDFKIFHDSLCKYESVGSSHPSIPYSANTCIWFSSLIKSSWIVNDSCWGTYLGCLYLLSKDIKWESYSMENSLRFHNIKKKIWSHLTNICFLESDYK